MTDEQLSAVGVGTRVLFNDLGVHDGRVAEISPGGDFYRIAESPRIYTAGTTFKWIHKDKIIEILPGGKRAGEWVTLNAQRSRHGEQAVLNAQLRENFSRPASSSQDDGDKRTMAATAGEGTAPKLGSGKCGGPTSATNSRVRCDVTAGETAQKSTRTKPK